MKHKSIVAAVTAISLSTLAVGSPALAAPPAGAGHAIQVVSDGTNVRISQSTIAAGKTTFDLSSSNPESELLLFSLKPGVTWDQAMNDFAEMDPAASTRDMTRDVNFFGLGDPGSQTMRVTADLPVGDYWIAELAPTFTGGMPTFTPLSVVKSGHHNVAPQPRNTAVVTGTSADTFEVHGTIPAHGAFTFVNDSDTLHFALLVPVIAGTTDEQVQAYFDLNSEEPPDFMIYGPTLNTEIVSPGRSTVVSTDLPAGTYVLLCFISDDETGMPHSLMGMHKVVTLR